MRHRRRILDILEAQDRKIGASAGAEDGFVCFESRYLGLGDPSRPVAFGVLSKNFASYILACSILLGSSPMDLVSHTADHGMK